MNSLIVSSGIPNGFTLFYATFTLEHTVLLTEKYILYKLSLHRNSQFRRYETYSFYGETEYNVVKIFPYVPQKLR